MPGTMKLVIVTPERQLLSFEVSEVTLPGAEGELGVLPGHAPLITELGIGELTYRGAYERPSATAGETVEQEFRPPDWRPCDRVGGNSGASRRD